MPTLAQRRRHHHPPNTLYRYKHLGTKVKGKVVTARRHVEEQTYSTSHS